MNIKTSVIARKEYDLSLNYYLLETSSVQSVEMR